MDDEHSTTKALPRKIWPWLNSMDLARPRFEQNMVQGKVPFCAPKLISRQARDPDDRCGIGQ